MKVILFHVLLLLAVCVCQAQRAPYKFSSQIDSIARIDSDDQHQGINHAYIGEYKRALEIFAPNHWRDTISMSQKAAFKKYYAEPAKAFILSMAHDSRIIIINEAHHMPMHRVFVMELLKGLRSEGYDMLGMETFDDADSGIVHRGYPVIKSGWYSAEPCYGNMIRRALSLKYRLFGYETDGTGEREIRQAENIAKVMRENPQSKMVIYCGYDHLIKDTMPGDDSWRHAMAGWLKLMTGVDPLTIDQVTLSETGRDTMDNPYRALIHARWACDTCRGDVKSCDPDRDYSIIMINDTGSLHVKRRYNADFSVYHPDTKYMNGRPEWQITDDKYGRNISKKIKIGFPCLAFVYRRGEDYDKAVPTDVIEIDSKDADIDVLLETKYKNVIILKNPKGQRQVINE